MLSITALSLEINSTNGLYGAFFQFEAGLNIIRANNTSGKSTIFQAIIYALGFEELIGGRNEKTMQSVLKDTVLDGKDQYRVLQSAVILQISNGKKEVTIKRSVINEKRKSQLVDVIEGPALTEPKNNYTQKQMYLHDSGAATDSNYGFHLFLEEFIGWKVPDVIDNSGNRIKLYLPLIAPSFIIEQKSGWSSFFATMPFYRVKNAEERIIEFLLNLDVFQNEQAKISLNIDKQTLVFKWQSLYQEFVRVGERNNAVMVGLPESPAIINNLSDIYFRINRNDNYYLIDELLVELQKEYDDLSKETEITVGENIEKNQTRLTQANDNLIRYSYTLEQWENENFIEKDQLKHYIRQKKNIEEDLENNKAARKMLNLGAEAKLSLAENKCPTCGHEINGTLLPIEVNQSPMDVERNIEFLTAQLKMLETFVNGQRKMVQDKETRINDLKSHIQILRQQIRSLKKDLISDERLPSEELIERKINLKRLIKLYEQLIETTQDLKEKVKILSKEWEHLKSAETKLAGILFTTQDSAKIEYLEVSFIKLLTQFNYQSKEKNSIKISRDKYVPVIEVKLPNEKPKYYDMRFDSSGSDHIRCMWAYYISLLKTSLTKNGNHPQLLIFDEPQQQSASTADFHQFLKELSLQTEAQSIVFASFQNSQSDFEAATKGLIFHKIQGNERFISKL
ncbi:AAA domain-containing protein [Arachidicoccus rhizosphaerae]|uniref:AAA domain-containing protein n=1 Tax=Arachidicoccus rhizosphaerae TaxID=551991 RepID=A0A1H3YSA3_9BACT|nr:ATP-binding protein [Arachidicoccus rhizosphaerae]SEA14287.1 AAA domain-containing protein [Arachidicoccus rhizosphaerae]